VVCCFRGKLDLAQPYACHVMLNHVTKRVFDIIAAFVGLFIFSPLLAAVSILIKLESSGPIFCRQIWYGYNDQKISVLQFRMTRQLSGERNLTETNSSAYTRIGRMLYESGIGTLPQLINVLAGEMSIVGTSLFATNPRDTLFKRRHTVKPGITGWSQLNECHADDVDLKRIAYDQYYADNQSFLFDLKIILMVLLSNEVYRKRHI
jgi:lipopolysaccharide/colanic/teichoic acid biosynthesis glycosyltransferase